MSTNAFHPGRKCVTPTEASDFFANINTEIENEKIQALFETGCPECKRVLLLAAVEMEARL